MPNNFHVHCSLACRPKAGVAPFLNRRPEAAAQIFCNFQLPVNQNTTKSQIFLSSTLANPPPRPQVSFPPPACLPSASTAVAGGDPGPPCHSERNAESTPYALMPLCTYDLCHCPLISPSPRFPRRDTRYQTRTTKCALVLFALTRPALST